MSSIDEPDSPTVDARLSRVVLAIAAFQSDERVLRLLEKAFGPGTPRFGAVIVVDSLGSGAIPEAIVANGWPVDYRDSPTNLGAAGNADLRLRVAAETGLDWCLALNNDGELNPAKVAALVACGEAGERVGAVYPQLRMTGADDRLDRPRKGFSLFGITADRVADDGPLEVDWSSSNGALYRLDAIREGANPWPALWMGFEDMALSWELKKRGWRQLLCRSVIVDDNYEFRKLKLFGRPVHVADKPVWYSYYHLRNLTLISRGTGGRAVGALRIAARALVDLGLIALVRNSKLERARLLVRGLIDGLRGKDGMGPVP